MSASKSQKWSSSATLNKLISRITRTLSLSSTKRPSLLKKKNKVGPQTLCIPTNTLFVPASVPVIRRQSTQPIASIVYHDDSSRYRNQYRTAIPLNIYTKNDLEENRDIEKDDDDDYYSRYSLGPNLSLFNISSDNIQYELDEYCGPINQQKNWLDNVFHSTKIEHS